MLLAAGLTVALSASVAQGAADKVKFERFAFKGMPAPVYYFAPHALEVGSRCEVAAIIIHGWGGGVTMTRDVAPFAAALADAVGPSNVAPYVISPLFPRRKVMEKRGISDDGRAIWNDSWGRALDKPGVPDDDWRGGGDAAGVRLSSFEVIDAILAAFGDRERFPALKRVVLTGFSAGGQFAGRYAAVGKGTVRDGVKVIYAAMGPSTELRLDPDVTWHYGIKNRPRYPALTSNDQMLENLSRRRVWRACGTDDVLGKSLDISPAAMLQGKNRYERFCNFKTYLKQFPGWAKQVSFRTLEGVGHQSSVAHTDPPFIDFVLGRNDGPRPLVIGVTEQWLGGKHGRVGSPVAGVNETYVEAIRRGGNIPVVICRTAKTDHLAQVLASLDMLILSGGADVEPSRYGAKPAPGLGLVQKDRDAFDFAVLEAALARNLPVMGVCRGVQVINVYFGGTLWQDLPSEFPVKDIRHRKSHSGERRHLVTIEPDSRLAAVLGTTAIGVNSQHHQAVKALAPGFRIVARAPDGVVEAIEHTSLPVVGVQFHPEGLVMCANDMFMTRLFRDLPRFVGFCPKE